MGSTTPVIKLDASSERKKRRPPSSSSDSPKRFIGVPPRILPVLGVGVPSGLKSRALFWLETKKPGAIALTLMPACAKCTASHWVKLDTAAFAALYAGILVRGLKAFIEEMLRMLPLPFFAISRAKTCVVRKAAVTLRSNTNLKPSAEREKKS